MNIKPLLTKEIYLYSNKELEMLFLHESLLKKYKEVLGKFLKFIMTKTETNYFTVPVVRTRVNQKNKIKTYSREEFYNMYRLMYIINKIITKVLNILIYSKLYYKHI